MIFIDYILRDYNRKIYSKEEKRFCNDCFNLKLFLEIPSIFYVCNVLIASNRIELNWDIIYGDDILS